MGPSSAAALLLVDVQQGLDHPRWGARNNPDAERRIAELLAAWRGAGWPVIHVQHLSTEPDSPLREDAPGHVFKAEALPARDEPVFRKKVNSAGAKDEGTAESRTERGRNGGRLVVVVATIWRAVAAANPVFAELVLPCLPCLLRGCANMAASCRTLHQSHPANTHRSV